MKKITQEDDLVLLERYRRELRYSDLTPLVIAGTFIFFKWLLTYQESLFWATLCLTIALIMITSESVSYKKNIRKELLKRGLL